MTAKYRAEWRPQCRAEEAAKIHRLDLEALELMRALQPRRVDGALRKSSAPGPTSIVASIISSGTIRIRAAGGKGSCRRGIELFEPFRCV
jgi:hypothetical protein